MSDKPKFKVQVTPTDAKFQDPFHGTTISILYTHPESPISPPKLSALRSLAENEFNKAVGNNGIIVTNEIADTSALNREYVVAAVHVPFRHESPKTLENVQVVANLLNMACN